MASEPLLTLTGFKPGSSSKADNTALFKTIVKLTSSQSLPSAQASSQSQIKSVNLNHLGFTLGDVGNVRDTGNLPCLVLGQLFAVPACFVAKPTSWSPPSVELTFKIQTMRLPKTPLMESPGYKWLFWTVLLPTVSGSILMGLRTDLGTTPESQFLDRSWRQVIPGVWYTVTPLSHNPTLREETKNY
ncbi:hypothetical protein DSO57_1005892 [Entomophthora muscae]|uniref:Uncharacterized protein n=1 Tax=Entomophthora muscae TaxID=34485 RepID=A0ACC2S9N2_9FUNG|nr:hypothetical protein DSO57_1005892 [Entomophthora muscae]